MCRGADKLTPGSFRAACAVTGVPASVVFLIVRVTRGVWAGPGDDPFHVWKLTFNLISQIIITPWEVLWCRDLDAERRVKTSHGKAWYVMELLSHDILIVGGGGAGLRAAIAIGEENPSLSVGVVSKVYPMRSHTVSAEGGAAAVIKPNDSLDDHAYDTISGADWMADQDAVEAFVNEAPREMIQLEHWGCPWSREPNGSVAVRPFGGMKTERTWFAADKTGFHMLHALFQTALKFNNVTRYDEWFVTRLLTHDGRCQGVTALELRSGQLRPIAGKAVILCTGGGGRIFPFTTNAAIKSGDGMAPGLPGRRSSQGYGVCPIPPHGPAGNGNPDYRGFPRRGRRPGEQGRIPLSPGLRPGAANRRQRSQTPAEKIDGTRAS